MKVKKIIRKNKTESVISKTKKDITDTTKSNVKPDIKPKSKATVKKVIRSISLEHKSNYKRKVRERTLSLAHSSDYNQKTRGINGSRSISNPINQRSQLKLMNKKLEVPIKNKSNNKDLKITWVNCPEYSQSMIDKANRGKEISEVIRVLNENKEDVDTLKLIAYDIDNDMIFEEAIEIYENNQEYWYLKLKNDKDKNKVINELLKLEEWFITIIETMPPKSEKEEWEDWKEREEYKLDNWHSIYCAEELQHLIVVEDRNIRTEVRRKIKRLMT